MGLFILVGSLSVSLAVFIGLIRLRKIVKTYQPFILILFLALLNEILSLVIIDVFHKSNAVSSNIFGLAEGLLWLWQFKKWEAFARHKWKFGSIMILLFITWIVENLLLWKINTFSSWYAIEYSFCLVFISINLVNRQIVTEKQNLFRNSIFLICSGVIIFYTYRIFIEC